MYRLLKGFIATLLVLTVSTLTRAQVAINTTGEGPDNSAMLDVSSNDKGILIPRMDSTSRTAILNPADGLLVYDITTTTFWYYDEERWNEIRNGSTQLSATDLVANLPEPDFSCTETVGSLDLNQNLFALTVDGNFVYVTGQGPPDRLSIIDVSDPVTPNLTGGFDAGLIPLDVAAAGDFAYVVNLEELRIIDVSDPVNPILRSCIPTNADFRFFISIALSNHLAYVLSSAFESMKVFDVSDPDSPIELGEYDFDLNSETNIQDVEVENNFAYVIDQGALEDGDNSADEVGKLYILDISDPNNLSLASELTLGPTPTDLEVADGVAYITDSDEDALRVIDVSDPSNPVQVSSLSTLIGNNDKSFTVAGDYAYYTSNDSLKVFDISDSSLPTVIRTTAFNNDNFIGSTVSGNYAYAINDDDFLRIIELSCTDDIITLNPLTGNIEPAQIPPQDNLGNHTATMNVDLANFNILNAGAINANSFFGNGSGLTNTGDDLGSHTATTNLNLADFNLTNGGILNAEQAKLGDINLGNESDDQSSSNRAGEGFTTTPWLYTNAIEAQGERGNQSTLITIGDDGTYGTDDEIHLVTSGSSRLQVDANGRVGIGRDPTAQRLEVNGNASKNAPGPWAGNSDARLKKNIQPLNAEATLERLLSLQGITYEWDDDQTDYERPTGIQYGFTAQNIQEVFPTLVEEDAEGYLQTAYGTYDAMYVEAFRALQQQIADQRERNTEQQRQIDALRAQNEELQQQVARIQEVEATLASLQRQLSALEHSVIGEK
ncbi:MAG: tail fiber domain-containing protein [Bacteroidota bacterium]